MHPMRQIVPPSKQPTYKNDALNAVNPEQGTYKPWKIIYTFQTSLDLKYHDRTATAKVEVERRDYFVMNPR